MDVIYSSLWPKKPLYQLTFSQNDYLCTSLGFIIQHGNTDWGIRLLGNELNGQKRLLVQIIDALGCPLLNCYLNKRPIDSQELNKIIDQLINKLPALQLQQLQNSNKLRRQSTKLTFFSFKLMHDKALKKPLNKHQKTKNVIQIDFIKKKKVY